MADRKALTRPSGAVVTVTQSDKILAGGLKTTDAATDVSLEATGAGSNAKVIADLDALFTARGETTPLSGVGDEALDPQFVRRNILGALNQLRESYNAILDDVILSKAVDQVLDQFTTDGDGSIEWYYFISSGTRLRGGKLMATWDESLGAVEILDTHTPDMAPITVEFSVFHDGTDLMLMATETGEHEYQFFATRVSPDGKYVSVSGGLDVLGTVKISAADETAEYLGTKLVPGTNITLTIQNPGGAETLLIDAGGGALTYYPTCRVAIPVSSVLPSGTFVGPVYTASAPGALPYLDDLIMQVGDLILIIDGTPIYGMGGILEVTDLGSVSTPVVLTRIPELEEASQALWGAMVSVTDGTQYAGTTWRIGVVGTDLRSTWYPETLLAVSRNANGIGMNLVQRNLDPLDHIHINGVTSVSNVLLGVKHVISNAILSTICGDSNTVADCYNVFAQASNSTLTMQNSGVFGSAHSILNTSYGNLLAGSGHTTTSTNQINSSGIFGVGHQLAIDGSNNWNLVGGHSHKLQKYVNHNIIAGYGHHTQGWYNALFGYTNKNQSEYGIIAGTGNNVGYNAFRSAVFGSNNQLSLGNMGNTISFYKSVNTVTMLDSDGLFTPEINGRNISIVSASGLNTGTFQITYVNPTEVNWLRVTGGGNEVASVNHVWRLADSSSDSLVAGNSHQVIASVAVSVLGYGNKVLDSSYSTMLGLGNVASGAPYGLVSGRYAKSTNWAVKAHSGGTPHANGYVVGSGQMLDFPFSCQTNGDAVVAMTLNGTGGVDSFFTTEDNHAYLFKAICIARCGSGSSSGGVKSWRLHFTVANEGGTARLVGTPLKEPLGSDTNANENSWDINPAVDGAMVKLEALGFVGEVIWWQCKVEAAEVGAYNPA
jgi:hypothetical protein